MEKQYIDFIKKLNIASGVVKKNTSNEWILTGSSAVMCMIFNSSSFNKFKQLSEFVNLCNKLKHPNDFDFLIPRDKYASPKSMDKPLTLDCNKSKVSGDSSSAKHEFKNGLIIDLTIYEMGRHKTIDDYIVVVDGIRCLAPKLILDFYTDYLTSRTTDDLPKINALNFIINNAMYSDNKLNSPKSGENRATCAKSLNFDDVCTSIKLDFSDDDDSTSTKLDFEDDS
jgi:hypothetical protein